VNGLRMDLPNVRVFNFFYSVLSSEIVDLCELDGTNIVTFLQNQCIDEEGIVTDITDGSTTRHFEKRFLGCSESTFQDINLHLSEISFQF